MSDKKKRGVDTSSSKKFDELVENSKQIEDDQMQTRSRIRKEFEHDNTLTRNKKQQLKSEKSTLRKVQNKKLERSGKKKKSW